MDIGHASLALILVAASAPALAGKPTPVGEVVSTGPLQVDQIAREAGVSSDDVRMVLGPSTPHARYRVCYDKKAAMVGAAIDRITLAQQQSAPSSERIASIATP